MSIIVAMLSFKNIRTSFLSIPQWEIQSGECWVVLGRNGSGKHHLTELITGKLECDEESFSHDKYCIRALSFEQQQAFYEQELHIDDTDFMDHLDPGTTVRQLLGLGDEAIPLELGFLNLDRILDRGYRLLSSGESRKALLAHSILQKPDFLILDEPYDSLDIQSKQELSSFFEHLLEQGKTQLLFLLNSFEEVFPWHTHIAILENGQFLAQGVREEIEQSSEIKALLSFDATTLPPWPEVSPQVLVNNPLVRLKQGKVQYGDTVIFENIDLEINAGQHTLITGPNGSGKSTLLSLLSGDHAQSYGNDLSVLGFDRGSGESIWELKKNLGIVSPEIHRGHRVAGSALHIVLGGFFDSIGLYKDVSKSQISHAKQWLSLVGLEEKVSVAFKKLSYGEQRLCLIARAMVKQPALLLLDEPTQGLDDVNRQRLLYFLEHLASQQHTTVVMVSHRLDEQLGLFEVFVELD